MLKKIITYANWINKSLLVNMILCSIILRRNWPQKNEEKSISYTIGTCNGQRKVVTSQCKWENFRDVEKSAGCFHKNISFLIRL